MLEFRQIKQRSQNELSRLFPKIITKPFIKKSSILQPIFKVMSCPPLSPATFKSSLQSLQKPTQQSISSLHQTLKHTEQYFTACINILEHNERVRQKYEGLMVEEDRDKQVEMKEVKELMRNAGLVGSKSEFVEFGDNKGHVVMGSDEKSIANNNNNRNNRSTMNSTSTNNRNMPAQLKQLHLPSSPDQYSFITVIQQDQYLKYHEQTLQKLLIQLTTINKLNRQLAQFISQSQKPNQQFPSSLLQSLKQLLVELSIQQMFRLQDNRYSQVMKYSLGRVFEVSRSIQKRRNSVEYYRGEVREAFVRMFYLQFVARKELEVVRNSIKQVIVANKQHLQRINMMSDNNNNNNKTNINNNQQPNRNLTLSKIHPKQLNTQLSQFSQYQRQVKQLSDYLCDKQQTIFKQLYDRKISKVILAINETTNMLVVGNKINRRLLEVLEGQLVEGRKSYYSEVGSKSVRGVQKEVVERQEITFVEEQINRFFQKFSTIQIEVREFVKSLHNTRHKLHNTKQNPQMINQNTFSKLFRRLQQMQLLFSSLQQKQQSSSTIIIKPKLTNEVKKRILQVQSSLIDELRNYAKNSKIKLFINYVPENDYPSVDDDKVSVVSQMSVVSSKSSIFVPRQLQLRDVILQLPTPTNSDMAKFPVLSVDELIVACNQFIAQSFVNNKSLCDQLEDFNNFSFQQLFYFVEKIDLQLQNLIKFNIRPVEQQPFNRPEPKTPTKNKSPQKQKPSSSPQKGKQKGRPSKQKSPVKSSTKPPVSTKSPTKLSPTKQQKPLNPIQSQQNLKRQTLSQLKNKLTLIKQILLPQVSQCRVSRIFQQNFQAQIFQQLSIILHSYKSRIFTQKVYFEAQKYGFLSFLQQRVKFIMTITKNMNELREIFLFVRVFSEEKVRLEASEESAYELVLRALLAQKEIVAYRRENSDLAQANKLSQQGVKFLQNQIYTPFLQMFKQLLNIISADSTMLKQLEGMLQSARLSIDVKQNVMKLCQQICQQKITFHQVQKRIQQLVAMYSAIQRYPILRFKKLETMMRVLRSALSLQVKSRAEDKIGLIRNYLKEKQLLPKSQPLLF